MKFTPLVIPDAYFIEPEPVADERGSFSRTFCRSEFEKRGLHFHFEQCSISVNHKKGTVRGMHFQKTPYAEAKLISCLRGKIYDVIVDLRPDSSTYRSWEAVVLSEKQMIYVPEGLAHGFQTLEDQTEIFYHISQPYAPAYTSGVRWNDTAFDIAWPLQVSVISLKDQQYPDFTP